MSRVARIALLYALVFAGVSAVFLLLFRTPLFGGEQVLFYRGVALLAVTLVLFVGGVAFYAWRGGSHVESLIAAAVASVALHLALFVVFPVTFDRSVTMHLLRTLEAEPACIAPAALEASFIETYVRERGAVERRLYEQGRIGMVSASGQCAALTARGERFLRFAERLGALYGLRQ